MGDFLPRREAELLTWLKTFNAAIDNAFAVEHVRADWRDAFHQSFAAFESAYRTAGAAETRSPTAISEKNRTRDGAKRDARRIVATLANVPTITGEQRLAYGMNLRSRGGDAGRRKPVTTAPVLRVIAKEGSRVCIELADSETGKTTRPKEASGFTLFQWVGKGDPPPIRHNWLYLGNYTKTTLDLRLPPSPDGVTRHRVWLAAAWIGYAGGPRWLNGPVCLPRADLGEPGRSAVPAEARGVGQAIESRAMQPLSLLPCTHGRRLGCGLTG